MKKRYLLALLLFLVIGGAAAVLMLNKSKPVPAAIRKQANFVIFYPSSKDAKIKSATFQYNSALKSVSFIINYMGKEVTFAEQASPDSFADDPNYYPKFAEKLNNYATFETVNGRVDLTRPNKVNSETGLMNAKGTLLFAKSNGDISEDSWKRLFNALSFVGPQ
jgi:hypothetical protein